MQIGRRIIYNKETGEIIAEMAEMDCEGIDVRPTANEIGYIDIPYGQDIDRFMRVKAYHVNPVTKEVVFDELREPVLTSEEQISQLQQQLLQAQGVI